MGGGCGMWVMYTLTLKEELKEDVAAESLELLKWNFSHLSKLSLEMLLDQNSMPGFFYAWEKTDF